MNIRQRAIAPAPGPVVNVTVDRNRVPVNYEVTFTLSPASVVGNPKYIVTLQFGDGTQTRARTTQLTHPYGAPGTYTYSVSVTSDPANDPISNRVPQVTLSAAPNAVATSQPVTFSAQLSENYPNLKYRFVFADGSQTAWQDSSQTTHEYVSPKTYLAYVDIGEAAGGSVKRIGGSVRKAVEVTKPITSRDPTVSLSARPTSVTRRQIVSFAATVVSDNKNVSYRFVFGDRTAPTAWQASSQANHRYLAAGNYSARVDVRTNNGSGGPSVSSSPLTIEVRNTAAPPRVSLTAAPASVGEQLPVFFQANVDSRNEQFRYRFNFGDGSPTTAWMGRAFDTHAYARAGVYAAYVELGRARNGRISAIDSGSQQITVNAFLPPATPTPTPSSGTSSPTPSQSGSATPTSTPSSGTSSPTPSQSGSASPTPTPSSGTASPTPSQSGGASPSSVAGSSPQGDARNGPNKWWIFPLVLLGLAAAYRIWKGLATPRPTLHPRLDPGVSTVGTERPLSIDFQLEFNPDIAAGKYGIESNEAGFIRSERKSND